MRYETFISIVQNAYVTVQHHYHGVSDDEHGREFVTGATVNRITLTNDRVFSYTYEYRHPRHRSDLVEIRLASEPWGGDFDSFEVIDLMGIRMSVDDIKEILLEISSLEYFDFDVLDPVTFCMIDTLGIADSDLIIADNDFGESIKFHGSVLTTIDAGDDTSITLYKTKSRFIAASQQAIGSTIIRRARIIHNIADLESLTQKSGNATLQSPKQLDELSHLLN